MKTSRARLAFALVIALQLAFSVSHQPPAIATPDAHGYWVQGRLIGEKRDGSRLLESSLEYVHPLWLHRPDGRFVSKYPPALPLLVAATRLSLGLRASLLINPVLAALGLLAAGLAAARIYGPKWSAPLAFMLAISPVYSQQSLWCFSHSAVFAVFSFAFLLTLISDEEAEAGRSRPGLRFGIGLLLGILPAIHYPEVLLGGGLVLWMIRRHRLRNSNLSSLFAELWPLLLGALIPIFALSWRNHQVFGAFWRTGYASTGEQAGFSLASFLRNFPGYSGALVLVGLGLLTPLAVASLIRAWSSPKRRPLAELYLFVSVPLLLLYSAYYWPAHVTAVPTLRFLHPLLLPLGLAAIAPLKDLSERGLGSGWRRKIWMTALLFQGLWSLGAIAADVLEARHLASQKRVLVRLTDLLESKLPPGSIVLGPEFALQHLDWVGHWRLADLDLLDAPSLGPLPDGGRRAGPQAMQSAAMMARLGPLAGLGPEARAARFRLELEAWASASKQEIYVIAGPGQLSKHRLLKAASLERVASLALPKMRFPGPPDHGPGGRGHPPNGPGARGPGPGSRPGSGRPPGPPGPGEAFSETEVLLLRWQGSRNSAPEPRVSEPDRSSKTSR